MSYSERKKVRGQRRKLERVLREIDAFVPFQDHTHRAYEHFHVPYGAWLGSPRTAGRVKTAFCRAWLEKSRQCIESKPADVPFCKVVSVIVCPHFEASQIIIFYDEAYYHAFWDRDGPAQKWIPLNGPQSFARSRGITTDLSEKGYTEIVFDGDGVVSRSQLWFYGELDT